MRRTLGLTEVGVVEEVLVEQDNGGTESDPDTANCGISLGSRRLNGVFPFSELQNVFGERGAKSHLT